jgi:hypothetical protein
MQFVRSCREIARWQGVTVSISVDTVGLALHGADLAASPAPADPIPVPPAGADPISMLVTAMTNGQTANLGAASADGTARRAVGGMAVAGSAAVHESADAVGADLFENLGASPNNAVSGLQDLMVPPQLQLAPTPPPVAALLLPPEAFSQALHAGESSPWRAAAEQLLAAGQGHRVVADSTAATAAGIDAAWQDGAQQAGANTALNATLINDLADGYSDTATALTAFAQHRDTAVQNTPTPEDYARARANLAQAQQTGNPVLMAIAASDLAELNTRSTEAQLGYQANVNDTAAQHDKPVATSNNIANPNEANTLIGNAGDAIEKGGTEAAEQAAVPKQAPPLIGPFGATQPELNQAARLASSNWETIAKVGKPLAGVGTAMELANGYSEFTSEMDAGSSAGDAMLDVLPKTTGGIAGGMGGALVGAEQGALIAGAACSIVPGVGTVTCGLIGGGVGAAIGGWGGSKLGERLGEDFSSAWRAAFG